LRIGGATDHGGFGLKQELVAQLRAAARMSDDRPRRSRRRKLAGLPIFTKAQARVEVPEARQTVSEA